MDKKQKRITVYIPEENHRKLKAQLAIQGLSVSEWFRRSIHKFLNETV